jgi:hypothetical protein
LGLFRLAPVGHTLFTLEALRRRKPADMPPLQWPTIAPPRTPIKMDEPSGKILLTKTTT